MADVEEIMDLHYIEEPQIAENIEAPLVGCRGERANKSVDYRKEDEKYGKENFGQREASRKEKQEEDERCVDEPLNIPHVLSPHFQSATKEWDDERRTKMLRVAPLPILNSVLTAVSPRSDAIAKYASVDTERITTAIWWNARAPRGCFR
jgi:hypothetical protein